MKKVIFVADFFKEDLIGGAELSLQVHIDTCPYEYEKIRSRDFVLDKADKNAFYIFSNFWGVCPDSIDRIPNLLKYAVIENDFKYCLYRSPEKHIAVNGRCICENTTHGQRISKFLAGALMIFWKSEKQKLWYESKFPMLKLHKHEIIGGMFTDKDIDKIAKLSKARKKDYWCVVGGSWIKGTSVGIEKCKRMGYKYIILENMSYDKALRTLARARGLVYLPLGMDTCPRVVTEAKMLGLTLDINDNCLQRTEAWFNKDLNGIVRHLCLTRKAFWERVKESYG